jgi:hypothetical protein
MPNNTQMNNRKGVFGKFPRKYLIPSIVAAIVIEPTSGIVYWRKYVLSLM